MGGRAVNQGVYGDDAYGNVDILLGWFAVSSAYEMARGSNMWLIKYLQVYLGDRNDLLVVQLDNEAIIANSRL